MAVSGPRAGGLARMTSSRVSSPLGRREDEAQRCQQQCVCAGPSVTFGENVGRHVSPEHGVADRAEQREVPAAAPTLPFVLKRLLVAEGPAGA